MNLLKRFNLLDKLKKFCPLDKSSFTTCLLARDSFAPSQDKLLQTRFLNFLEQSERINENNKAVSINAQEFNLQIPASRINEKDNFAEETTEECSSEYNAIVESIKTHSQPRNNSGNKIALSSIDDDCCKILRKLSLSKILRLLQLLTRFRPDKVTSLKFYKYSLHNVRKLLEYKKLSKRESLQLLFLESLRKKLAFHDVQFVVKHLPPMSDLSLMEQCIVASTTFKSNVRLKDSELLEDVIEANAGDLVKDPAILVTLCKALRLAGPSSGCRFENLSKAIIDNTLSFTIICASHTLSLYAEANLRYSAVLQRLFDDSMKHLAERKESVREFTRPPEKDLERLLWASSVLNYKLRSSDVLQLSSFINRKYDKLSKKPILLANTLVSLWILNCRLKNIVERSFEEKVFWPIAKEEKDWRSLARLQLLVSCVKIEAPEIEVPNEILRPQKVGMKILRPVRRLRTVIDDLAKKLDIDEIAIDCPVDGIYIPGVSFRLKKEKSFHVDLVNETTCFKNTIIPHGFMSLKLRLLSKIDIYSILITGTQLKNMETVSSSLERYIENIVQ